MLSFRGTRYEVQEMNDNDQHRLEVVYPKEHVLSIKNVSQVVSEEYCGAISFGFGLSRERTNPRAKDVNPLSPAA